MTSAPSNEVADFLKKGGKVVKAQNAVPVTVAEVLDYLVSYGVRVKYSPGDSKAYSYEGKRYTLTKFVELANVHRKAHQLPPFAVRMNICVGGRRPSE